MTTTSRRLETLSLLQTHPGISAPTLAERLGVEGLETAAVTALAKLTQVVPSQWQTRLTALTDVQASPSRSPRRADRDVLVQLALACRAGEAIRFRHRRLASGETQAVEVQPYRLVTLRRLWYLVACPRGGDEWRVYAVDRISQAQPLGISVPSPEPPEDAAQLVSRSLAHGRWRHQVRIRVHTSADLVRELVDPSVAAVVEDGDECELHFGTDDLDWAARWLAYLNLDLDVVEPTQLSDRLRNFGRWLAERY